MADQTHPDQRALTELHLNLSGVAADLGRAITAADIARRRAPELAGENDPEHAVRSWAESEALRWAAQARETLTTVLDYHRRTRLELEVVEADRPD